MKRIMLVSALLCASLSVSAALRGWTAADYVPGPIAFWDAIDNAGTGTHDASAATWKNLGTGGATYDLTIKDAVWCDGNSLSNGIDKLAAYGSTNISYTTSEFAIENYTTANSSDTSRWIFSNGKDAYCILEHNVVGFKDYIGLKSFGYNNTGFHTLAWEATGPVPYLDGAETGTTTRGAFTATGGYGYSGKICLGLNTVNMLRSFHGKYHSIRLYDRVLTAEEIAWNHALDAARFAGGVVAVAPVASAMPDAVVGSTLSGVGGVEPCGCYMVDPSEGHVFTTLPCANVAGVSYACTGYTLERWDANAGEWGTPAAHAGEYSVAVAAGDKVRIVWQWSPASGTLSATCYVTNGLIAYWDAIDNVGTGVHDPSATTWKNLGSGGATYDLTVKDAVWRDGNSLSNGINTLAAYGSTSISYVTSEFAIENYNVGGEDGNSRWVFCNGISTYGVGAYCVLCPSVTMFQNGWETAAMTLHRTGFHVLAWEGEGKTHYVDGVSVATNRAANGWGTGGGNGYDGKMFLGVNTANMIRGFHGKYHSIRLYDRVLSAAEIAHNRMVDEVRFANSSAVPTSGVVVVASHVAGLEGREPNGLYAPDAWTFSAGAATKTVRGVEYECSGYTLETWDASASVWCAPVTCSGNTYTSPSGIEFASVRLTWLWTPVHGLRTAADYAVADYVPVGLIAQWDAIDNAGTGVHDASATIWKNLGAGGAKYDLTVKDAVWRDGNSLSNGINTLAAYGSRSISYAASEFAIENYNVGGEDSHARWIFCNGVNTYCVLENTSFEFKNGKSANAFGFRSTGFHTLAWEATDFTHYLDGAAVPVTGSSNWGAGGGNGYAGKIFLGLNTGHNDMIRGFHGKYHSIRLYDRVLSAGEVARNRAVDVARFGGGLAATNVVVAASEWNGALAAGEYEVLGSWTFTAAASPRDGSLANTVRIQTLQGDGTWGGAQSIEGNSYTYVAGTSPATVRIEFARSKSVVIIFR